MTVTDEALPCSADGARAGPGPEAGDGAEATAGGRAGDGSGGRAGSGDDAGAAVAAALARDLDAGFAALYEAYRGAVFSTALRLCGRWAEAEDLSAEAFLRAYRALAGYEPGRIEGLRPRAWLLAILTNVWRNSLRSAARRPVAAPMEDAPDPPDPGEGVEDAAARRETGRELAALLAELPEAQRAAVVLRHVTGLPVAEVAAVLELPEGTVKSHVSRGLARLRRLRGAPGGRERREGREGPRERREGGR